MALIENILHEIGISFAQKNENYGLVFEWAKAKDKLPKRLVQSLSKVKPDYILIYEDKPIALFFDFTGGEKKSHDDLHKKIWNTASNPLAIFVIRENDLDIYNGFSFDTGETKFEAFLENIKHEDFGEKNNQFSIWDYLLGNKLTEIKPKNTVDFELLNNLQQTKEALEVAGLKKEIANNLLGRLLFIAFLYDRKLLSRKDNLKKYFDFNKKQEKREDFCNLIKNRSSLYKFFANLKSELNGDLFPVTEFEKQDVEQRHLEILSDLFAGGQSLFEMYDFRIIPVELISEIYEQMMGKKDQEEKSAYYTPSFLVDYIIAKTVGPHLKTNKTCKVFDPSCGSGIFLVESLRQIIEVNLDDKRKIEPEKLKNLVTENIFGVDLDSKAVNVTIFSLYLVLLDYLDENEIANFKFPPVKNKNIFESDFFDEVNEFNDVIKNQKLDFILGNPPWKRGSRGLHSKYTQKYEIPVSDKQIAQSFVARIKDFSENKEPECFMVLPSQSMFYGSNGQDFRQDFLLRKAKIIEVLEMSSVRSGGYLFPKAQSPTSLIKFQFCKDIKEVNQNVVLHASIKPNIFLKKLKLIVIEKNDEKRIKQKYFVENDWLWKTILYGNVLDYYLIKGLKDRNNKTINDIKNVVFAGGFIKGENKKPRPELENMKYIEGEDFVVGDYFSTNLQNKFKEIKLKYPELQFTRSGVVDIYKSPHILLKRSLKEKPTLTLLNENCAFPNTIYGIHSEDNDLLYFLMGYFSSSLVQYLLFNLSATWGIRQPEVYQEEYKKLPIILNKDFQNSLSQKIQDLLKIQNTTTNFSLNNEDQEKHKKINGILKEINESVFKIFEISEFEKKLINYTQEISIPLFFNKQKPIQSLSLGDERLQEYAQTFYNFFSQRWDGNDTHFSVKIYWHKYVVVMVFEISEDKPEEKISFEKIEGKDFLEKIKTIITFGEEKITEKFYKQRDVRGFNENSFYIVKPNQYKNWHPAVAEADIREFVAAMWDADQS